MGNCTTRTPKAKTSPQNVVTIRRKKETDNKDGLLPEGSASFEKQREKEREREELQINYRGIPNFYQTDSVSLSMNCEPIYGINGLSNLGNTCFMNSILQVLANTQPLSDYFLSKIHLKELIVTSDDSIACSFGDFIEKMWCTSFKIIKPNKFHKSLRKRTSIFGKYSQEDAQEFLVYLLDSVHEELNRAKTGNRTKPLPPPKKKHPKLDSAKYNSRQKELESQSLKEWEAHLRLNQSIIVDLFQGQLQSELICSLCHNRQQKFDPVMYLSLPIPKANKVDLYSCFEAMCRKEQDIRFRCEHCKQTQNGSKQLFIYKLPNILIVHLKRFEVTGSGRMQKIQSHVDYPIESLNLESLCNTVQREEPIYDLYGVVNHEGNMAYGHYFAHLRNQDNKQWYNFNDRQVSVVQDPSSLIQASGYILFYAKKTNDYFLRQSMSTPEQWPYFVKQSVLPRPEKVAPKQEESPVISLTSSQMH